MIPGIRWKSKVIYVDEETGEVLTKYNADTNYIITKTTKNVTINNLQTAGTIEYTKQCRRNPQTTINFGGKGTDR